MTAHITASKQKPIAAIVSVKNLLLLLAAEHLKLDVFWTIYINKESQMEPIWPNIDVYI